MNLCADESMIAYLGKHSWKVYIARKPNPNGIRGYVLAYVLPTSNQPVTLAMVPDLR